MPKDFIETLGMLRTAQDEANVAPQTPCGRSSLFLTPSWLPFPTGFLFETPANQFSRVSWRSAEVRWLCRLSDFIYPVLLAFAFPREGLYIMGCRALRWILCHWKINLSSVRKQETSQPQMELTKYISISLGCCLHSASQSRVVNGIFKPRSSNLWIHPITWLNRYLILIRWLTSLGNKPFCVADLPRQTVSSIVISWVLPLSQPTRPEDAHRVAGTAAALTLFFRGGVCQPWAHSKAQCAWNTLV